MLGPLIACPFILMGKGRNLRWSLTRWTAPLWCRCARLPRPLMCRWSGTRRRSRRLFSVARKHWFCVWALRRPCIMGWKFPCQLSRRLRLTLLFCPCVTWRSGCNYRWSLRTARPIYSRQSWAIRRTL